MAEENDLVKFYSLVQVDLDNQKTDRLSMFVLPAGFFAKMDHRGRLLAGISIKKITG
jgi:hypothetical protein